MNHSARYQLWFDLETTSADPDYTSILEIGLVLTDDTLEPMAEANFLNPEAFHELRLANLHPDVIKMHANSGLWRELQAVNHSLPQSLAEIEIAISRWLDELIGDDFLPLPAGGSSIDKFDRPIVHRLMPHLDKRLTPWSHDVAVIRRYLEDICGRPPLDIPKAKTHRALEDTHVALHEMRVYRDHHMLMDRHLDRLAETAPVPR